MDRRTRALFLVALGALVVVVGVGSTLFGESGVVDPDAPPDTTAVVGVVVGVDAVSLGDVRSFDLRTTDGVVLTFALDELENGVEFPPGHLAEHQATAEPVRVFYRDEGGTLQAITLADAST